MEETKIDSSLPPTPRTLEPWEKAFASFMKFNEDRFKITGKAPGPAGFFRAGYLAGQVDLRKAETDENGEKVNGTGQK